MHQVETKTVKKYNNIARTICFRVLRFRESFFFASSHSQGKLF